MLRRWLKPCPRCRDNNLLEMKNNSRRVVMCMQCGYLLLRDEIRFLVEDVVLEKAADHQKTAA